MTILAKPFKVDNLVPKFEALEQSSQNFNLIPKYKYKTHTHIQLELIYMFFIYNKKIIDILSQVENITKILCKLH